jgi:dTDP-4-dehydrorhamnose 3,5-epimerase
MEPVVHGDERGFLIETYRREVMTELGVDEVLVQHNHSRSRRGVVRGMHFQPGMAKLIQCVRGAIYDVLVDVRRGSPSFGRWQAFTLDDQSHLQLWCPDGFAHGFCVLSELADVIYGCTAYHDSSIEGGFRFDDPEVGIEWPSDVTLIASPRDRGAPALSEIAATLPFAYA